MDRSTFHEALAGQSMLDALAPDHNLDRSYRGFKVMMPSSSRMKFGQNISHADLTAALTGRESNELKKKESDAASSNNLLQTSATQSSIHRSSSYGGQSE